MSHVSSTRECTREVKVTNVHSYTYQKWVSMASRSETAAKHPRRRGRALKIIGGVTVVVLIGWLIYASVNIVAPSQGDRQAQSDAVVSLAPQEERLPTAQQLVADGVADTLLISYFGHDPMNNIAASTDGLMPLSNYCEPGEEPEIVCFTPEEDATIGEAYAVANIAKERSWTSLTLVTDPFHAFRTRFIFNQCLGDDFQVNVVYPERDLSFTQWAWHVVYENAAFVKAAWQTATRC